MVSVPALAAGVDPRTPAIGIEAQWPGAAQRWPIPLGPRPPPTVRKYLSQVQTQPNPPPEAASTAALPEEAFKAESEKRWEDAERLYREAIAKEPTRLDLLQHLKDVLAAEGKRAEAAEALGKAADLRHDDADMQVEASAAFAFAERPVDALRYVDRALALRPGDIDLHERRARLATWAGKYDEAAESLRLLIAARPDDVELKRDLGQVLTWQNRPQEAESLLSEYVAQRPGDKDGLLALSRTEATLGNSERATELLDRYRAAGGDEETYNRELADILPRAAMRAESEKQFPEAERIYRSMLAKEPDRTDLSTRLADVLAAEGKTREAAQVVARAADRQPGDAELQLRASEAFAGAGRPVDALRYVDRALAIRKDDPDLLERRARLATWAGRYAEAVESLRKLIEARPTDVDLKRDLGRVQLYQGRFGEAAPLLSAYLAQHPNDPDALLDLARVERGRRNLKAAEDLLKRYRAAGGDEATYRRELQLLRTGGRGPSGPSLAGPGAPANVPAGVIAAEGKKNWAAAERLLRAALVREPGRVDLWRRLSDDLAVQGKRRDAAEALAASADLRVEDADPALHASEAFAFADMPAEALRYADRALAIRPEDLALQRRRAKLAIWAGNNAEAEASLRFLLAANPNDLEATRDLGRVMGWQGQSDEAVGLLSQYLLQRPDDKDAVLDLARNEAGRGNSAVAVELLERYRAAGGDDLTYRRELAVFMAWAGWSRTALGLADAGLANDPADFQFRFARASAERDLYQYGLATADLDSLVQLRPEAKELAGLRRTIEVPERPYLQFDAGARNESDHVRAAATEISYHQPLNDAWWLVAGGTADFLSATPSSGFGPYFGGDFIARGSGWIGTQTRLDDGAIASGRVGETASGRVGRPVWQIGLDDRWSDEWRFQFLNLRDFQLVSPRSLSLDITRIDTTAQLTYTPDLSWTLVGLAEEAEISDGNRLLHANFSPRRAVLRTQDWNIDLGVTGNWFGYSFTPEHGYYSPSFYQQYLVDAFVYYKLSDEDGISLVVSLGALKDNVLHNFRLSNNYAVEATFGMLSDWMVKLRAGYTNNGAVSGIFSAENVGLTLVRRF